MSATRLPQRTARTTPERLIALGLVAATTLALFWIEAKRPPLGVAGQYVYPYRPVTRPSAFLLLPVLALPLGGALAFVLFRRRGLARWQEWAVVAVLAAGSLLLHLGGACATKLFPGAELAWPFLHVHWEGAYAVKAREADDVGRFLSNYAHALDVSPVPGTPRWVHIHHAEVHPPGLILGFVALERFYGRFPGLDAAVRRWAAAALPSASTLDHQEAFRIRHPVAVGLTAALLTMVLASLTPVLGFATLRSMLPAVPSLVGAGLLALLPGVHLFSPSVDVAYPFLTLLVCFAGVRLVVTGRWGWGLALGGVLYAACFVHVGFALAAGVLGLATLFLWRAEQPQKRIGEMARAAWRPLAAAAAGFLTPALVLQAAVGYPTFRVLLLCVRNNAYFNAEAARTYWPWVAVVPFEFALSLGFALALVAGAGWLLEAGRAARQRSLRGASAVLLAIGAVLLALDLFGVNRGETARLWLFLTPFLVIGAVDLVWRRAREPRRILAALALAQALQVVWLTVLVDARLTTTFFAGVLGRQ